MPGCNPWEVGASLEGCRSSFEDIPLRSRIEITRARRKARRRIVQCTLIITNMLSLSLKAYFLLFVIMAEKIAEKSYTIICASIVSYHIR